MYTSGSTGKPKGVVVTHKNLLATTTLLDLINSDDVYIAHLPLAHIFELMAEFACIAYGCCLCYADPKTLTATGSYPLGALEQYKPTLMVAVPKLWDVIKKAVQGKVAMESPVKQYLVNTAFETRLRARKLGFDTPLFKALVFKKFAKIVGGRLRLAASGGGPLNGDVQDFVSTCFGVPLVQGYGLTETCAGLTLQDLYDDRQGVAGVPIPCCEVKLVSCGEINDKAGIPYLKSDRKDVNGNDVFGRGEVCVKGANVGLGYYMMPEKTKEEFDEDGWFHTGDIGQFASDGSIQIVDRKKNLIKLKGGEYIAVENMETNYGNSKFVDPVSGGICCYGDGDMDRPIALMQLNIPIVKQWAKENGISGDISTIIDSKDLYDAVMKDMESQHKAAGLSRIEKLVAITFIVDDPWTPENGCLTAANKLQRRAVVEKHEKVFNETRKRGIF
jgi:long-chain acyl-CoA synthetase